MAIATVGSALGPVQDTNSTTTITYTLGLGETTTAGNLVVLYVAAAGSTAAVAASATDSKGNSYAVGPSVAPSGSVAASIVYGRQSLGLVAADTITVTLSHTSTDKQMIVRELTGQDASPLEISVSAGLGGSGSNAPAVTSSPVPTTVASSYVATMTVWNGSTTNTADSSLTAVYAGHFDNGGAGQTKQMSVREKITVATGVQARTDSLGANQPWAVLLATFKASSAPPTSTAKACARGLSTRDKDKPPTGQDAAYSNRMIDIVWKVIQPTEGVIDATELARLDALVDAAVTAGDTATFRVFAGYSTPAWLKTKVGTFKHADTNAGNLINVQTCPIFWTSTFWGYWDFLMQQLGNHYDGGNSPTARQAAVRGIQSSGMGGIAYPEALQRHTNAQANRSEMVGGGGGWDGADNNGNGGTNIPVPGAGFSFAQDVATQHKAIDIHNARWPNTAMHFAFNPWQVLYSQTEAGKTYTGGNQVYLGGDQPGIPNTKALIDYAISVLGPTNRFVQENNSIRESFFLTAALDKAQSVAGSTITVNSSANLASSGTAWVVKAGVYGTYTRFTYTGKTSTSLTGCSSGVGNYAAGDQVVQLKTDGQGQMYSYFLSKPFARYYQCATTTRVGSADQTMRFAIAALNANACEPTNYSGTTTPYDTPNLTAQDAGFKVNSLPAGGATAHIPTNTALPTIDFPAAGYTPGTVLSGRLGAWNPGSHALSSLDIQWYRKNPATNISTSVRGPTSKADTTLTDNYTLVSGDLNSTIYVTVTATNSDGTSSAVASQETPLIITPAAPAPTNTILPVATPSAPVSGDTITWDTGTWAGMPTSFSWDISRSNDGGATWNLKKSGTDPTWATSDTDIGWAFKADVTANNGQPSAAPATSVATSAVVGTPVITLTTSADTVPTDVSTYTFTGTVLPRGQGVTIAAFNVNGMAITVNPDGSFSQLVTVAPGVNTYTFTATDSATHTSTESAQILRTVILTSADVDEIEVRIHQRGLGSV